MTYSPRTEALAFRIWSHCQPIEWDITVPDLADALDEPTNRVRTVVNLKGWQTRLRSVKARDEDSGAHMRNAFDGPTYLRRGDVDFRVSIGAAE
jgi:hypothetical protein